MLANFRDLGREAALRFSEVGRVTPCALCDADGVQRDCPPYQFVLRFADVR